MTIFKCKMCGGTLEFTPGDTVAVCDSCGTKQTLPKLDDDRRANLYDRANHFRRNNEYDKAMGIYEQILAEDNTDAEAYWSLVLCRYGIEYVEDPSTHRRMPTVNRAQFTSVFDDDNYKSALHYADAAQKEVYASEAEAINEIQKGILAISQKEQPFDVFICYKETDANGRRTQDSVLANDLYHQLTQEGFKVFFARITLEDKLGTAYEPYIFAALNSAKVMVVLGTKPEHFNAVWVKNEWSRYLALVKNSGGKKMLIPAYKDMDPYDLPEEFSHLQAQDMSKLGFMQDLIRGIKKIISTDTLQNTVKDPAVVNSGNTAVEPLLRRVFMFLEDGNWKEADDYCEKVLDQDPENAQAYLGKLMAELQVRKQALLSDCEQSFEDNGNYLKILRFGDKKLQSALGDYISHINDRNETARLEAERQAELHRIAVEKRAKKIKKIAVISAPIVCVCIVFVIVLNTVNIRKQKYNNALDMIESGDYEAGYAILEELGENKAIQSNKYDRAIKLIDSGDYQTAYVLLNGIEYKDSAEKLQSVKQLLRTKVIPGDTIFFGKYEQDNDTSNGKEDIVWLVLDKKDDKVLLISKYALADKEFDEGRTYTTWEKSSLRKWLNEDFINDAFNSEEQSKLQITNVSADKNPKLDVDSGNATTDKVFLLSAVEVEKYFPSEEERKIAVNNKGKHYLKPWWLRTSGYTPQVYRVDVRSSIYNASLVYVDGAINYEGYSVNLEYGVRPAMWISID